MGLEEKVNAKENSGSGQTHVFAIGSKGIPAEYGGFESFMENLTKHRQSRDIVYHVSRLAKDSREFEYNNAMVFDVPVPDIGPAKAVYYDIAALRRSIRYCRDNALDKSNESSLVFFIMACRIGPFLKHYARKIHRLGGRLYVNPDGHEWKRSKWSGPIRRYWKLSERFMVKAADWLICDSRAIESYIRSEYGVQKTCFIPYGAELTQPGAMTEESVREAYDSWMRQHAIKPEYYLMVGRFVPENNYETVLSEYLRADTPRDLVIITTPNDRFAASLDQKLNWSRDKRIRFVGTVYDSDLLREIRKNAYGYIHGHEVGGTNPSLLESLGTTGLNLLFDCEFNREVGEESCLYWTKEEGCLSRLLSECDRMSATAWEEYGRKAKKRIEDQYTWTAVVQQYESVWHG